MMTLGIPLVTGNAFGWISIIGSSMEIPIHKHTVSPQVFELTVGDPAYVYVDAKKTAKAILQADRD